MIGKRKKRRSKSRSGVRRMIKNIIVISLALGIFSVGSFALWAATLQIPTLESFEQRKVVQSTKIYDRTGEVLLFDVFENVKRTIVPFDEISPHVKNATLAIEDTEFYEHGGIKPRSIMRAAFVNFASLSFKEGGSTITQQVIKNSVLSPEKTLSRKFKEWILATKLEQIADKDEIFSLYLNEIPFGGNIYGVEEASRSFFNKSSSDLTIAESAYLAALPQAPTTLSPYGSNFEQLENRKNTVLREMLSNGFITEEEHREALEEEVVFREREDIKIRAPHFVMYVKQQLEEMYGEKALEEAGLRVITTLDYELQEKAEELALRYALENEQNFNAENIGLTAVDPKTGDILVMVGSRDYFDENIDGNFNIATSNNRQPGSTFKPFAYAEAFNKGYTPDTVLFDVKTQFSTSCPPSDRTSAGACYSPNNYDNIFRGPVTMREALAQSINIPAVKTSYLAGMNDVLSLAQNMGVSGLGTSGQYGLSLALGGGEVSLLDMTSAYGVFANEGIKAPHQPILRVEDREGRVLYEKDTRLERVLPEQTSLLISDVLSDNAARTPAFGGNSLLHFSGRDVAVKTGTTNDYVDAWIIGYTPNISIGAWAGNNNNTPMERRIAGLIIAPFWNEFMREALNTRPNESFKRPAPEDSLDSLKPILRGEWRGGIPYYIDSVSGKLATEFTPPDLVEERFVGGVHSILYWVDRRDPRGPVPQNPESDPQFPLWEYAVRQWVGAQNIEEFTQDSIPEEYDDVHTEESLPQITITEPTNNNNYDQNQSITITTDYDGMYPLSRVEYFVNGSYIGDARNEPFIFTFIPEEMDFTQEGLNTIRVVAHDSVLNRVETESSFTIENN